MTRYFWIVLAILVAAGSAVAQQPMGGVRPPFPLNLVSPMQSHTFPCNPTGSPAPPQECTFSNNAQWNGSTVTIAGGSGSPSITGAYTLTGDSGPQCYTFTSGVLQSIVDGACGAPSQTIASISPTACTFTSGIANGDLNSCAFSVTMSPSSPASTAALSLTGTNTGGFHLSGSGCTNISLGVCKMQQSASGTAANVYTDVSVIAAQPGITGSVSQQLTLTGTEAGPPGSQVTTATWTNHSGIALAVGSPISGAQPFRYSDIPVGHHPRIQDAVTHVAQSQQWDEIATWNENFAAWNGQISGTTMTVNSISSGRIAIGTGVTGANVAPNTFVIALGTATGGTGTYIVNNSQSIAAEGMSYANDGSWRHGVWTILLPVAVQAGASYQIEFTDDPTPYSAGSGPALSTLCSGGNAHDLKIHLTNIRNQDLSVRKTGDATFSFCTAVSNTGRDAPRTLQNGVVAAMYELRGNFVYTDATQDPLLYARCPVKLYTTGDVEWTCQIYNSWMNVAAGSAGNSGNPGPVGLTNDPQVVTYHPEIDDGATKVLAWDNLSWTVASSSNPIVQTGAGQHATVGCGEDFSGYLANCFFNAASTGTDAWYYGQALWVTSTGTPPGGLAANNLYWVYNSSSDNWGNGPVDSFLPGDTTHFTMGNSPNPSNHPAAALTSSQGSGTTTFQYMIWHPVRMSWTTVDATTDENWAPAGGGATRTTRPVYPGLTAPEKFYWEQTGVVTPITSNQPSRAISSIRYDLGLDGNYHAMGRNNVIGEIGGAKRPDLGFPNEFGSYCWAVQTLAACRVARVFSLSASMYPIRSLLNEATGSIPAINNGPPTGPGGNGVGGSYSQLGAPMPSTVVNKAANVVAPLEGVPSSIMSNWESGVFASTGGTYISHEPNFPGFTFAMWGWRGYLDLLWQETNGIFSVIDTYASTSGLGFEGVRNIQSNGNLQTGPVYAAVMVNCCQNRGSARMLWNDTLAAALGADGNIERQYFRDMQIENDNYDTGYEQYRNGTNSNFTVGINPPNTPTGGGTGGANAPTGQDMFIINYVFSAAYMMATLQHQPMGRKWLSKTAQIIEGIVGAQLPGISFNGTVTGSISDFYSVDFSNNWSLHNGGADFRFGNIGQYMNGVDATDFAGFCCFASFSGNVWNLASGGWVQTAGDTVKLINGAWFAGAFLLDELQGDTFYSIVPTATPSDGHFTIICPAGHAVTAGCPTPGSAFTSYHRSGTLIPSEGGEALIDRPQFTPETAAGSDYNDPSYTWEAGEMVTAMQVLGGIAPHALTNHNLRTGCPTRNCSNQSYENWDPTVTVPGVTGTIP
jgi:hypothetical protein